MCAYGCMLVYSCGLTVGVYVYAYVRPYKGPRHIGVGITDSGMLV